MCKKLLKHFKKNNSLFSFPHSPYSSFPLLRERVPEGRERSRGLGGEVDFSKIDIKAGKMTFDQRIQLGKIFQEQGREFETLCKVFQCLHNYTPKVDDIKNLLPYYYEIIEGLTHWLQAESTLLQNEPTSEEISAGIKELSEKIGEFGTIKSLAKNYSKDPDDILAWEYGKVFGILYTDLEEYKYQKRYNKILERKYHRK